MHLSRDTRFQLYGRGRESWEPRICLQDGNVRKYLRYSSFPAIPREGRKCYALGKDEDRQIDRQIQILTQIGRCKQIHKLAGWMCRQCTDRQYTDREMLRTGIKMYIDKQIYADLNFNCQIQIDTDRWWDVQIDMYRGTYIDRKIYGKRKR